MAQTYCLRLLPPRPTFVHDMTVEERALMGQHAAYACTFFEQGKLLIYGPVLDPEGSFGIAILQAYSEEEIKAFIAADPTIKAGLNRYTYAPHDPRRSPGAAGLKQSGRFRLGNRSRALRQWRGRGG